MLFPSLTFPSAPLLPYSLIFSNTAFPAYLYSGWFSHTLGNLRPMLLLFLILVFSHLSHVTTPGVQPNPYPLSLWCYATISSSVIHFSSCPQSFPASGSFTMSQLITSGGQIIGVSASTSVLPMNTQDWSPLGWIGWISMQSKGLSRVFSNTTVQKHQFFRAQLSSQSNSHIHTWPLEKP